MGFAAIAAALIATPAAAFDWAIQAKAIMIKVIYMPGYAQFMFDHDSVNCPAGSLLKSPAQGDDYASRIANTQAVLAALMTAKTSGQQVLVYDRNADFTSKPALEVNV